MHSFLLIGQSNMAGRGLLNEAQPIDNSNLYILRNGRWQKLFRPINPDRKTSGVNLAESFAEAYAKTHGVEVGLICCADGGTCIDQWAPGELLYDNAVFNARLAMRTSTLAGILWHQGESDCKGDRPLYYQQKLQKMVRTLRKDLQAENIPFIVGGLGEYLVNYKKDPDHGLYFPEINRQLESLALEEGWGFASAKGLTPNEDQLHFNAASLHTFGLRYFEEYQRLMRGKSLAGAQPESDTERSELELL